MLFAAGEKLPYLFTLHSSLFTLHSSLFTKKERHPVVPFFFISLQRYGRQMNGAILPPEAVATAALILLVAPLAGKQNVTNLKEVERCARALVCRSHFFLPQTSVFFIVTCFWVFVNNFFSQPLFFAIPIGFLCMLHKKTSRSLAGDFSAEIKSFVDKSKRLCYDICV